MSENAGLEDLDTLSPALIREFKGQPAFPNSRLADNTHDSAVTFHGVSQLSFKRPQFVSSADQMAETGTSAEDLTGRSVAKPSQLVQLDRRADPPDYLGAKWLCFDKLSGGSIGVA